MIYFNTKDDHMEEIKTASKLRSATTAEDFRIYGLRQEKNPPIFMEYSRNHDEAGKLFMKAKTLTSFFNLNGIKFECETFEDNEQPDDDKPIDYKVYIGLRRDIRNNIPLSAAILKTIVYFIDGKITLTDKSRIVMAKFV